MKIQFKRATPPGHKRWEIDRPTLVYATNRANIATGLDLTMQQMQAIMLELEKCQTGEDE